MISDEELKLYLDPEMQKFFRGKMGLWQVGDPCLCENDLFIITDEDPLWHTICIIRVIADEELPNEIWIKEDIPSRLPLPIDPNNPERGLWGMIDWIQFDSIDVLENGNLSLVLPHGKVYEGAPTLALLRALRAQIGEGK